MFISFFPLFDCFLNFVLLRLCIAVDFEQGSLAGLPYSNNYWQAYTPRRSCSCCCWGACKLHSDLSFSACHTLCIFFSVITLQIFLTFFGGKSLGCDLQFSTVSLWSADHLSLYTISISRRHAKNNNCKSIYFGNISYE